MTDQEIVLRAFTELQLIAADYIEPDSRDAEITLAGLKKPNKSGNGANASLMVAPLGGLTR
jgi:hypothetical protein